MTNILYTVETSLSMCSSYMRGNEAQRTWLNLTLGKKRTTPTYETHEDQA